MSLILQLLLLFLLLCPITILADFTSHYYLGRYEQRRKMDILFRRSQRTESESGRDKWLAETITYPLNLGPYGGQVLAVHVVVRQSSTDMGRLSLTHGGIGGTFFEMVVEADHTTYIVCNYTVYGKKPFTRTRRVKFPQDVQRIGHDEL